MKKLFCFGLFFTFCFTSIKAQTWVWGRQATCALNLNAQGEGYCVAEDSKANVFFAGGYFDTIRFGAYTLPDNPASSDDQVFLVKYDPNGNALWARQSSRITGSSDAESVATDIYGNVYICGYFSSKVAFETDTLNTNFISGVFLVKYDANGNLKWAKQGNQHMDVHNAGTGYGVATDGRGNPYITGYFQDTLSFGGFTLITPTNDINFFLVKYDTNGNVIWAKQPKNITPDNIAYSISIYDSNVYIAGYYQDTLVLGRDTLTCPYSYTPANVFIAKYDTSGSVEWAKEGIVKSHAQFYQPRPCVTTDVSGNAIMGGNFQDTILFGASMLTDNIGQSDVFLAKYSPSGNVLWALCPKILNNYSSWNGFAVATDGGRHIYYYGGVDNISFHDEGLAFGNDTLSYTNADDAGFISEFDSLGNFLCGSILPSGGDDRGGITCDASGNNGYYGQDFKFQTSYRFGNDSLGPEYVQENPILVKWENCANNPFYVSGRADTVCTNTCNGSATASPYAGHPPYTYSWSNGATTQTVTGLCAGNYSVVVKDNLAKQDTTRVTITAISPNARVVPTFDTICKGDSVKLTGSGGLTYKWSNGNTSSSIWVKPNSTAIYTLHAFVSSCNDSAKAKITLIPDITARIDIKDSIICPKDSSYLTVTSSNGSATYKWNNGATTSSIRVSDSVTTAYTATIYGTCGDSLQFAKTVTVNPKTTISVVANPDTICQYSSTALSVTGTGVQITYKWSNGSTNSTITVTPVATTTYTANVYGKCDSAHKTITVTVIPIPKPVITGKDSICDGASDTITISGGTIYLWSNGSTSSKYVFKKVTGDSTTSVTLFNGKCSADTTIKIGVIEPPSVSLNLEHICINQCTTLEANASGTSLKYLWSNHAQTDTTTVCPTSDSSFTVTVYNACGIIGSTATVTVYNPVLLACCDTVIDRGDTVTLSASKDSAYKWSPTTGLNCSTCSIVIASPSVTTTYTVTGTDRHSCNIERTITILVDVYCFDFAVPNVFTPNGDGINDYFKILPLPPEEVLYMDTYTITIYDRWGKEIYKSTNPTQSWNGNTEGGAQASDGVYYYIITAACQGKNYNKDGFVQLIRQ